MDPINEAWDNDAFRLIKTLISFSVDNANL